ncbi:MULTISPECIES: sporulation protein YunB [Bacillus]|uniref:sporulation protein YunB n=1 Tax=Bacillus TaxID=1386 RepID=UPI00035D8D42|nr:MULTISPECIES: sporulation protein YunB [Bacillus]
MRRWRYRRRSSFRRKPLSFPKVLFYSFIIFLLLNLLSLWIVNRSITPIIKEVAKTEVKRIATEIINESINENIKGKIDINKLIVVRGNPSIYSFDPNEYTRVMTETTKDIEKRLGIGHNGDFSNRDFNQIKSSQLENIVYYLPLGVATRNTLLSNVGPKIPVEVSLVREVKSKIRTKMTSSGINNTLMELYLDIEVDIGIVIPFTTDEEPIKLEMLIGSYLLPGKVPDFYSGGNSIPVPAIVQEKEDKKE